MTRSRDDGKAGRRTTGAPGPDRATATRAAWHGRCSDSGEGRRGMYSILYLIGAIVVIIVILKLLGLY